MRVFVITLFLILLNVNLYSQIYTRPQQFIFKGYHISKNDTLSQNDVILTCNGKQWMSPRDNSPIKDSWSITWSYKNYQKGVSNKENTGVKENAERLFIHPIRLDEYEILEFNPFPMVIYPLTIGKEWSWNLENINEIYYKSLKVKNRNYPKIVKNEYKIENKISWYLKKGNKKIECYLIRSVGNCSMGKTWLTFYFSEIYGFVYLEYKTLNDDVFIFELIEKKNI